MQVDTYQVKNSTGMVIFFSNVIPKLWKRKQAIILTQWFDLYKKSFFSLITNNMNQFLLITKNISFSGKTVHFTIILKQSIKIAFSIIKRILFLLSIIVNHVLFSKFLPFSIFVLMNLVLTTIRAPSWYKINFTQHNWCRHH